MLANRSEILLYLGLADGVSEADLALLSMIHPLAESVFKDWLGTSGEYQQCVEYLPIGLPYQDRDELYDGQVQAGRVMLLSRNGGEQTLQLTHLPVLVTGLEIREDITGQSGQNTPSFSSDSLLTSGTDYWLDTDSTGLLSETGIVYRNGIWPNSPRSVRATYYGGYTATQLAGEQGGKIKLAAIITVAEAFRIAKSRQTKNGIIKGSESIGKYSYTNASALLSMSGGFNVPPAAKEMAFSRRNFGKVFG
jgi:hypothetical protein